MDQRESNKKLIELIQQGIDTEKNYMQLYNQNHGFIYEAIKRRVHDIYEIDDLMQSAFLALAKAVEIYDTTRPLEESNFLQILKYCIWNELRDRDLPAYMVTKIIKYNKAKDKLCARLNRKATDHEIALEMGIEFNELDTIKAARRLRYKVSLDKPIDEDGETTLLDLYSDEQADEDTDFDSTYEDGEVKKALQEALNKLPANNKDLIEKRYYKKWTLEKCGEELNVSKERVRQIESKSMRLLRKDPELEKRLEGYIDSYHPMGCSRFNNTWTSSTEWVVLEREKKLEEWRNKRYKEMLKGIEGFENIF